MRKYLLEQIDDAAVVQYYADGFDALPLDQKVLAWHLSQAALAGRDIYYDQRYRHSLEMREVLEEILTHAAGIEPATLDEIRRYAKLFWIKDGQLMQRTSAEYIAGATGKPADDEAQRKRQIVSIDVAGTAAIAKVELDYPKTRFTDYLSLLKTGDEWQIINKIFYSEPKAK